MTKNAILPRSRAGLRGRAILATGAAALLAATAVLAPSAAAQPLDLLDLEVVVGVDGTLGLDADQTADLIGLIQQGTEVSLVNEAGTEVELVVNADGDLEPAAGAELLPGDYEIQLEPQATAEGSSDLGGSSDLAGSSEVAGTPVTVDTANELNLDAALTASVADLLGAGVGVSLVNDTGDSVALDLDAQGNVVLAAGETLPAGDYELQVDGSSAEGSSADLSSAVGSSDTTDPDTTDPGTDPTVPDTCVSAGLTVGIPLALLIPVALGDQLNIPGLEPLSSQVNIAIQDLNTQVQQNLGVFSDQAASVAEQFNLSVASSNGGTADLAGSAAALAVAAAAGYYLYDNCTA